MIANLTAREIRTLHAALGQIGHVAGPGGELVNAENVRDALTVAARDSLDEIVDADAAGEFSPKLGYLASRDDEMDHTLTRIYAEQCLSDLAAISPMRSLVVRLRFGVGYERPARLAEIAEAAGVSVERVRQMVNQGLQELRNLYGVAVN